MKAKYIVAISLLCLLIGGVVTYFYLTRNEIKPRIEIIDKLNKKTDSLNVKLDSLIIIITCNEVVIDSLNNIISYKNIYIYKINKKYENIFNLIRTLSVDDHIVLFSNYLSKEDSLRARYFNIDESDTTGGVQFFLR